MERCPIMLSYAIFGLKLEVTNAIYDIHVEYQYTYLLFIYLVITLTINYIGSKTINVLRYIGNTLLNCLRVSFRYCSRCIWFCSGPYNCRCRLLLRSSEKVKLQIHQMCFAKPITYWNALSTWYIWTQFVRVKYWTHI